MGKDFFFSQALPHVRKSLNSFPLLFSSVLFPVLLLLQLGLQDQVLRWETERPGRGGGERAHLQCVRPVSILFLLPQAKMFLIVHISRLPGPVQGGGSPKRPGRRHGHAAVERCEKEMPVFIQICTVYVRSNRLSGACLEWNQLPC